MAVRRVLGYTIVGERDFSHVNGGPEDCYYHIDSSSGYPCLAFNYPSKIWASAEEAEQILYRDFQYIRPSDGILRVVRVVVEEVSQHRETDITHEEFKRREALRKLTDEEKRLLGLV